MSEYPSKYTDKKITAANYVTEMMCERQAKLSGEVLPVRFWDNENFKKMYKMNLIMASRLLQKYDEVAVIGILSKNPNILSLRDKGFKAKLDKYKPVSVTKETEEIIVADTMAKPRTQMAKKTKIEEL